MIELCLPWPPSVNRIWRSVGGRVLLSADGRAYRQIVAAAVLEQHGPADPLTGRLSMTLRAYPPDRRRRDVDNLAKLVLDALQGHLFTDDALCVRLITSKEYGPVGEVFVRLLWT